MGRVRFKALGMLNIYIYIYAINLKMCRTLDLRVKSSLTGKADQLYKWDRTSYY